MNSYRRHRDEILQRRRAANGLHCLDCNKNLFRISFAKEHAALTGHRVRLRDESNLDSEYLSESERMNA